MRTLIRLIVCAVLAAPALAQPPSQTWQRVIEVPGNRGEITGMTLAPNGDIIVAGFINREGKDVQGSTSDAWLARYSGDGQQLWSRTFGGPDRDEINDLKLDSDGSIIIAGMANFRFDGGVRSDSFMARYDGAGNLVWKTLVHDDPRRIVLSRLALADDGAILAFGEDAMIGAGGSRALVVSLTRDGETRWQFNPPEFVDGITYLNESARIGGVGKDRLHVQAMQNTILDLAPARCFSVSLATGEGVDEPCAPVALTSAFTTERVGLYEDDDVNVRKHDPTGAVIWERAFATENGDGFHVLAATPDGGVIGAGYQIDGPKVGRHNWDGLLMKLDASGEVVWRRTFGGSRREEFKGVAVLPDGTIVVAGFTGSQGGAKDWNPWLMRLNSRGELEDEALKELQTRQK